MRHYKGLLGSHAKQLATSQAVHTPFLKYIPSSQATQCYCSL